MSGPWEKPGASRGPAAVMSRVELSVIIPCWNDPKALGRILQTLAGLEGARDAQIIVADASADDTCRQIAREAGALVAHCPKPNRGAQMNAGAGLATGRTLLFQHADTDLSEAHLDALKRAMRDPAPVGGAFHRRFDQRHAWLEWLEEVARYLNESGSTLYGDQSIFVRRDVFERLGGFAAIPLMEDLEFSKRLRRAGPTVVLDPPIRSSSRHHDRRGAWRTSIRNGLMMGLFRLGFSPEKLHAWYYRRPVFD